MSKNAVTLDLSEEACARLAKLSIADNCRPEAIVEHLLMGRTVIFDGKEVVVELLAASLAHDLPKALAWLSGDRPKSECRHLRCEAGTRRCLDCDERAPE